MFRNSRLISWKSRIWGLLSIAVVVAMLGALLLPAPGMASEGVDPVIRLSSEDAPPCSDDPNASCITETFKADLTHTASYVFDCNGTILNIPIPVEIWGLTIHVPIPTAACTLFAMGTKFAVYETSPGGTSTKILEKQYIGLKQEGQFAIKANYTYSLDLNAHGRDYREALEYLNLGTFDSFAEVRYQEIDPPDESCENAIPMDLPYSGNLEFSGDHDWQRIKSPVKGTMVLKLDVPADKDYQMDVRNDACSAVWVPSQNGTGIDEQLIMSVDPVYYRVHVYGKTPEDWGQSYAISAQWDLNDNEWENAVPFDMPFQGNLEYSGDHDWQRVQVPVGDTFLVLDVPDDRNYQFEVWRDDIKQLLGSSANGIGAYESVKVPQPGYYRVHVFGADPTSDFDAPYRVFLDGIPPTTTISIAGTMGNNGWYRSNIEITLNATDNPDGTRLQKTEYSFSSTPDNTCPGPWYPYMAPIQGTLEGSGYLVYRSIDKAGNVEQCQKQFIGVDKTPPAIDVRSPQSMDYLHSATFYLLWKPFEKGSGMDTSSAMLDGQPVANGQLIDLFFLNLGPHMVTVQASDMAGNSTTVAIPFNVVADIDSLRAVTARAYDLGWINKQSTYNNLDATLRAAEQSIDKGQYRVAKRQLLVYMLQLRLYNGKSINQQAYDLLRRDALYVLLHLP